MHRAIRLGVLMAAVMAAVAIGGCFPIELSVSPKGEVLIPREEGFCVFDPGKGTAKLLTAAAGDKPAFGAFSRDGASILAISQTRGGGMGSSFAVRVMPTAGGAAKTLTTASNLTYARWSGDGQFVSLTRVGDQKNEAADENLPELVLLDAGKATSKTLLSGVSMIHRWFPDSKSILIFHIASKDKDKGQYTGKLVKVDVATGKPTALATALCERKPFFDLSPDGTKALFVAVKAAGASETVPASSADDAKLFELDLAKGGAPRAVKEDVGFALYSPKGTKVLLGSRDEKDGAIELAVSDAAVAASRTIAKDAARNTGGGGPDTVDIYPGWVNDETVHYLRLRTVYGTVGKNLQLVTIGADGKGVRNLQPAIGTALEGQAAGK